MVLDPIPQSLPVHFFGSRPQPPTSQSSVPWCIKKEPCIATSFKTSPVFYGEELCSQTTSILSKKSPALQRHFKRALHCNVISKEPCLLWGRALQSSDVHSIKKEPCIATSFQKSPAFDQMSFTLYSKSPVFYEKKALCGENPTFYHKSPIFYPKSPMLQVKSLTFYWKNVCSQTYVRTLRRGAL